MLKMNSEVYKKKDETTPVLLHSEKSNQTSDRMEQFLNLLLDHLNNWEGILNEMETGLSQRVNLIGNYESQ